MQYMKSLSVKVIFIFVLLIFPLNFLAIYQADTMLKDTIGQVKIAEQNVVDVYANALENRMDNTASMLHYLRTEDTDCLAMQVQTDVDSYRYKSAKQKLYFKVQSMGSMIEGSEGYFYYYPKVNDIFVRNVEAPYIGTDKTEKLKTIVCKSNSVLKNGWNIYSYEGKKVAVLVVRLRNITYGAWIDIDKFMDQINKGIEYESSQLLLLNKGETLQKEEGYIYIKGSAKNIYLWLGLKEKEILQKMAVYPRIMQIMAIIYLILVPILYILMRKLVLKPLKQINKAHEQLQLGNQEYRITRTASSIEFAEAYRSFNEMAENLQKLKIQIYENQIEKQQIELRNLQLQIRPHFLLNTFNLIYSLAEKKESEPIQNITIYLSEYFRYLFRSNKQLELFVKEMKLIQGYIYMASIRYENLVELSVDLSVDLDPEIEFVRTPPLLIHNFIENAVKYGFRQGKMLHIDLQGRYDEGKVIFTVTDDGSGMSDDILERNQKMFQGELIPENANGHLGLYNSYKRLKYFYGNEANITLTSEPGEITCFTICFPYNLEVDDDSFDGE